MNPELEKVMSLVKKMLALAADPGAAEGEKDNALRMAHKYLAKYNLDVSDLAGVEDARYIPQDRYIHEIVLDGRPWARGIVGECGRLNFCRVYHRKVWGTTRKIGYVFAGSEANARTAALFAEEFVTQTYSEYSKRKKFGRAVARSFATGVWMTLHNRVSKLIEEERNEDKRMDQMHTLEDKSNQEFEAEKIKPRTSVVRRSQGAKVVMDAYLEGMAHGNKMGLNRRV